MEGLEVLHELVGSHVDETQIRLVSDDVAVQLLQRIGEKSVRIRTSSTTGPSNDLSFRVDEKGRPLRDLGVKNTTQPAKRKQTKALFLLKVSMFFLV